MEKKNYPFSYHDAMDPSLLYVKSETEAYYIHFNPMVPSPWTVDTISKVTGKENVDTVINGAIDPTSAEWYNAEDGEEKPWELCGSNHDHAQYDILIEKYGENYHAHKPKHK